jgi:hypothetical protein
LRKILPFFSYLFHPIFIPVQATLFYLFYTIDLFETKKEMYYVLFQIIIITILIPILFYLLLRATGKVASIMIADVSQRKIPLIIQCFLIIFLLRQNITLAQYPELHFFFLAGLLSTVMALLLLFATIKASLHMMTISGLTCFVIGLTLALEQKNTYPIALLFLANGFVASSRLAMKAHTPKELIIGALLGSIPQLILWRFWL